RLLLQAKTAAGLPKAGAIDFLPFGLTACRPALQTIITYALQQRLIPRKVEVDDLFDDTTPALDSCPHAADQVYPVTATAMICLEPSAPAYQIYLPNQGSLGVRHLAASASRSTLCPQRLCLQGASHPQLPEIQQSGESLGETHGHRPADVLSARGAAHRSDLGRGSEL